MAISDVAEYMHLTDEQVEELGRELDKIREEVEASRGADDAAYINTMIKVQRGLATAGRLTLMLTPHSRKAKACCGNWRVTPPMNSDLQRGSIMAANRPRWLNE